MTIRYTTDTNGIDWEKVRQTLIEDQFHNGRSAEQYAASFENSHTAVIAHDGDQPVGTARVLSDGVVNAYIVDVWTYRPYRRQGIARQMLTMLEETVPGQHICLWTEAAHGFYETLGYQRASATLYEKMVGDWLNGA